MCYMESWVEVREVVAGLAAAIDPSRVPVAEAAGLLPVLTATKNMLAAVEARFALRVAESGRWRIGGAKEPAEDLARRTGVSVTQARGTLEAAQAIEELPVLRDAAMSGRLSAGQAALIASASAVAPDAAAGLLKTARRGSFRELQDAAQSVKAAADPDPEATRRRIHAARGLWSRRDADGSQVMCWRDNPERIAHGLAGIAAAREELFRAARTAGQRERPEALDADALYLTLTAGPAGAGRPDPRRRRAGGRWGQAKVLVRVDAPAAARSRPAGGEVCEIAGSGPVAVSAVAGMLADGAALALVATDGDTVTTVAHVPRPAAGRADITDPAVVGGLLTRHGRPVADVVHPGRRPTAAQVSALQWTSPGCSVLGCTNLRCETDHTTGWAITRTTRLGDLDRLCGHHHDLKTHHGWRLAPGTGKRLFLPPPGVAGHARAP